MEPVVTNPKTPFTRTLTTLSSLVINAGQVVNVLMPVLSVKQKVVVGAVLLGAQGVVNAIAAGFNPDGTKAYTNCDSVPPKDQGEPQQKAV